MEMKSQQQLKDLSIDREAADRNRNIEDEEDKNKKINSYTIFIYVYIIYIKAPENSMTMSPKRPERLVEGLYGVQLKKM